MIEKSKMAITVLAALLTFLTTADGYADMTVHFIDVGQGGGVLIEKDGKNIMYDCGDVGAGKDVLDYLDTFEINKIDLMIVSHAHQDHIAGCIDVLNSTVKVVKVYHNGSKATTKVWKKFLKAAKEKSGQVDVIEGDKTEGSLEFIVGYDSHGRFSEEADDSILVRVVDDQVSVLLTGDCEGPCEREVVKNSPVRATVLNVGHHGSNDSSKIEFLKKVAPKIAVISVGVNTYRHPRTEVLARLDQVKAKKYRTDQRGSVIIHSNGQKVTKVETEK